MGVTHIDNVLMILGVSTQMTETQRESVTKELMKGFNSKAIEANTKVTGGQSVMNPWPMIGGTAISVVQKEKVIMPNNSQVGDLIILTKPIGTQCIVNAAQWLIESTDQWKKLSTFIKEEDLWDAYVSIENSMSRLNKKGAELMIKYNANACTDVTGFGIKGHAENLVNAQNNKNLKYVINKIPTFKNVQLINDEIKNFKIRDGYSPETSGGLMLTINKENGKKFVEEMHQNNENAWIIGEVCESDFNKVELNANLEFIETLI